MVDNGEGEFAPPRQTNSMKPIEDIDNARNIVEDLLEEHKTNKLPFILKTGLSFLSRGIESYYDRLETNTKPKEMFSQSISLKQSFVVVLLLHASVIGGIAWTSNKNTLTKEEDKKYIGVTLAAEPIPEPTPKVKPDSNWPKPKEYIVKKGDTFNGIVKRFKLNPTKFKKINKIKNENKLYVGQKLILL